MSVNLQNKKKLGIGVAALVAAVIILGVGTYAFFSSTGAPTGTIGTAGKLKLNESSTESVNLGTFVPGGDHHVRKLTFKNEGSITGKLTFAIAVQDSEDGCIGDERSAGDTTCSPGANGELSQKLKVKVLKDGTEVYDNLVSGLPASKALDGDVTNEQAVTYIFDYYLPNGDGADNIVQGDSATVTTTATLKQPN